MEPVVRKALRHSVDARDAPIPSLQGRTADGSSRTQLPVWASIRPLRQNRRKRRLRWRVKPYLPVTVTRVVRLGPAVSRWCHRLHSSPGVAVQTPASFRRKFVNWPEGAKTSCATPRVDRRALDLGSLKITADTISWGQWGASRTLTVKLWKIMRQWVSPQDRTSAGFRCRVSFSSIREIIQSLYQADAPHYLGKLNQ